MIYIKENNSFVEVSKGTKADSFIPPGFIYIQYPGFDKPETLWSGNWSEITSSYADNFFRASDANNPLGTSQESMTKNNFSFSIKVIDILSISSSEAQS